MNVDQTSYSIADIGFWVSDFCLHHLHLPPALLFYCLIVVILSFSLHIQSHDFLLLILCLPTSPPSLVYQYVSFTMILLLKISYSMLDTVLAHVQTSLQRLKKCALLSTFYTVFSCRLNLILLFPCEIDCVIREQKIL
jgi:hypothetical protein